MCLFKPKNISVFETYGLITANQKLVNASPTLNQCKSQQNTMKVKLELK